MKVNHWITGYECGDCGGKVWMLRKETKVRPTHRTDGSYINCGDYDEICT